MVNPVSHRAEHSDMSRQLSIVKLGVEDWVLCITMEENIGQPDTYRVLDWNGPITKIRFPS